MRVGDVVVFHGWHVCQILDINDGFALIDGPTACGYSSLEYLSSPTEAQIERFEQWLNGINQPKDRLKANG
jgi:hypothetical protein